MSNLNKLSYVEAMEIALNECYKCFQQNKYCAISAIQYELIAWKHGVRKTDLATEFNKRMATGQFDE